MNLEEFNRHARILGRKYVPDVLEEISKKGWIQASDLASYLHISTATAVNYLKELESIGVLKKKKVKGETGDVWRYNINKYDIVLETTIPDNLKKE
ncbi:MAG: HTH domain-containing protein [Candidatus Saliniplasma sp.]